MRLCQEVLHTLQGHERGSDLSDELRQEGQRETQHGEQRHRLVHLRDREGVARPCVAREGDNGHEDGPSEERHPEPREQDRLATEDAALLLPPLLNAVTERPLPGVVLDDPHPLHHLRDDAHALVHVRQQFFAQGLQLHGKHAG